ncbi:hypothetical protein Nocox_10115 [Nonomuraea coxensis DSM 45129]|uniref:Uncharacterized protein n=1 Tax=Nonomuraea coxensis DSM 45129 TaxID=1122611 RepID=A0ABX8TZ47_9ACTN|nr:hypothetical protein Nocox_10115 [Nonomuraea coxensis DSM 45129]
MDAATPLRLPGAAFCPLSRAFQRAIPRGSAHKPSGSGNLLLAPYQLGDTSRSMWWSRTRRSWPACHTGAGASTPRRTATLASWPPGLLASRGFRRIRRRPCPRALSVTAPKRPVPCPCGHTSSIREQVLLAVAGDQTPMGTSKGDSRPALRTSSASGAVHASRPPSPGGNPSARRRCFGGPPETSPEARRASRPGLYAIRVDVPTSEDDVAQTDGDWPRLHGASYTCSSSKQDILGYLGRPLDLRDQSPLSLSLTGGRACWARTGPSAVRHIGSTGGSSSMSSPHPTRSNRAELINQTGPGNGRGRRYVLGGTHIDDLYRRIGEPYGCVTEFLR